MEIFFTRPWMRAFSGLFINISAGWFGVAFITPNFTDAFSFEAIFTLKRDVVFGIVFLFATVKIEEGLEL